MNDKKIKVTISLSQDILFSIDKQARIEGLSRSAYITKLYNDEYERQIGYLERYKNVFGIEI